MSAAEAEKPYYITTLLNRTKQLIAHSTDENVKGITIAAPNNNKCVVRLFSTSSSNATNIHVKINGTVYALGTLADGLLNICNVNSNSDELYNKTFMYRFYKETMSIEYLCTLDMNTSYFYNIAAQNFYICEGTIQKTSSWAVKHSYRYSYSFDGITWTYISITRILFTKVIDGTVYIVANIPNPDNTDSIVTAVYKIENESITQVFLADRDAFENTYTGTLDFNFDDSQYIFYIGKDGIYYRYFYFSVDGTFSQSVRYTTKLSLGGDTPVSTTSYSWKNWTGDCTIMGDKYSITYANNVITIQKYENDVVISSKNITVSEPASNAKLIGAFINN